MKSSKELFPLSVSYLNKHNQLISINLQNKIETGDFYDFFLGEIPASKTKFGVKLFKKCDQKLKIIEIYSQEVKILKNYIQNPRICQLLGYSELKNDKNYIFFLVFEFANHNLSSYLKKEKKFLTIENIDIFFEEMIIILSDLQSKGIFYRDIKPINILFFPSEKNQYKLRNFDISDDFLSILKNNFALNIDLKGTPRYLSPELKILYKNVIKFDDKLVDQQNQTFILNNQIFNKNENSIDFKKKLNNCFKYDIFSLGLTILELTGHDINNLNDDEKKLKSEIKNFVSFYKNTKTAKFIGKILNWNLEERYDFLEIMDKFIYYYDMTVNKISENIKINGDLLSISDNIHFFEHIHIEDNENILKNHFFSCGNSLSSRISKEFLKLFLTPMNKNELKSLLKKEIEGFFNDLSNLFPSSNIKKEEIDINKILFREKDKIEKKHYFNIFCEI